jgi:hypothetical protein
VTLGRTDDARAALREAIDRLPPTFVRERAIYTTAIAASYVPDGEIKHAATLAGEALGIAADTGSTRAISDVADLRHQLEPSTLSAVQALDQQLREIRLKVDSRRPRRGRR